MIQAVVLARASSGKQVTKGDTLDDQLTQCLNHLDAEGWELDKFFPFVESGSTDERKYFEEVLAYCENPANKIHYIVFKNISRFTRQGGSMYLNIKDRMRKVGVELRDIYGTIGKEVNTMAKYGLEYDWSKYSPTESSEVFEADKAKGYVRDALTQMLGAEVDYVNKGYWNRRPPYGYSNKKEDTPDDRIRNILVENPEEAKYIRKMYSLRVEGKLNDIEIVKELNSIGYQSRFFRARDQKTMKAIGKKGGKPLTVKQFQEFIKKPIYTGIILEKWTYYKPVVGKFNGLVDLNTFNLANRGKVQLIKNGEGVQILYNVNPERGKRRSRNNPLYPFKSVVMCPICEKPLAGSASVGKGGKKHPAYHCFRKHKYWRVKRDVFHETVYRCIRGLRFNDKFLKLFEVSFLEVWREKRIRAVEDSRMAEEHVASLLIEQKNILDTLKGASSAAVKTALEGQYEDLETQIISARGNRTSKEVAESEIKKALNYALYLMEHLEELLINEANPLQQCQLFGLVFTKLPTYDEILNGTPKLSPVFALNTNSDLSKSDLVTLRIEHPNQIIANLVDLFNLFSPDVLQPAVVLSL